MDNSLLESVITQRNELYNDIINYQQKENLTEIEKKSIMELVSAFSTVDQCIAKRMGPTSLQGVDAHYYEQQAYLVCENSGNNVLINFASRLLQLNELCEGFGTGNNNTEFDNHETNSSESEYYGTNNSYIENEHRKEINKENEKIGEKTEKIKESKKIPENEKKTVRLKINQKIYRIFISADFNEFQTEREHIKNVILKLWN